MTGNPVWWQGLWKAREMLRIPEPFRQNDLFGKAVHFRRVFHTPTEPFTYMHVIDPRSKKKTSVWGCCPRGCQFVLRETQVDAYGNANRAIRCHCGVLIPHPWCFDNWLDT